MLESEGGGGGRWIDAVMREFVEGSWELRINGRLLLDTDVGQQYSTGAERGAH